MTTEAAITEINKFWNDTDPLLFGTSDNTGHAERLQAEFGVTFPDMLNDYITRFAPSEEFYFETVGNPMRVYGVDDLKYQQEGYNYNPRNKTVIEGWNRSLFIFSDEGADPVVLDLENPGDGILKLSHGQGNWESGATVANTIGQFLLCSAALHHALTGFEEEAIVDDEKGFNLADNAAKWYFSNMKKWAGAYYEEWCSVFDNH